MDFLVRKRFMPQRIFLQKITQIYTNSFFKEGTKSRGEKR